MKKWLNESNITQNIAEYFGVGNLLFFFLEVNLLIGQLLFLKESLILNIIICLIAMSFYLFFKDKATSKQKKMGLFLFKIHIILFTMLFINSVLISALYGLKGGLISILYMLNIGIVISFFAFFLQDEVNEKFNKLDEINFMNMFIKEHEEIKLGDAILGYEVDENGKKTDKPVILPLKDRFLHMLILGPTGCGKTSQSLIPMINRDMQNLEMGITVLEPKGDLAEKIYAMAKYYNREVVYFNPILPDCPYFNPLFGVESDVVENMATTFNMLNPDSPQFFKDMSENLIRRSIKLLKRLYGDDATLLDLNTIVWDTNGNGKRMLMEFSRQTSSNPEIQKENEEIFSWFMNDYYTGTTGDRGATKTYEHCSGVRSQISKLVSNKYLRRVLNPPKGHGSDLDFDDAFERGIVITIGTAQGSLRDLGRYLGYFIILQLQASVFRRPGTEFTRKHNMLFIDEFQVYSNPGFSDMLTMGRSYRVASHLATQARAQIGMGGGKDGKNFVELVSTNARNKIIYPGVSSTDAKYYSEEFGEILKQNISKSIGKKRYFSTINDERLQIKLQETLEARFSLTDIIYRPFGHITYCIIKNNSIQTPGVSQIEYIPKDLNDTLDKMVMEYNEEQFLKNPELHNLIEENVNDAMNVGANTDLRNNDVVIRNIPKVQESVVKDPIKDLEKKLDIDTFEKRWFEDDINYGNNSNDDSEVTEFVSNEEKVITQSSVTIGSDLILEDVEEDDLM